MSDWPWVVGAFALTWGVLGIYVIRLHHRLARARAEFEAEAGQHGEMTTETER